MLNMSLQPFVCLGNDERGKARFDSLLAQFGLGNRLLKDISKIEEVMNTSINWKEVNTILDEKRAEAIRFLEKSLA